MKTTHQIVVVQLDAMTAVFNVFFIYSLLFLHNYYNIIYIIYILYIIFLLFLLILYYFLFFIVFLIIITFFFYYYYLYFIRSIVVMWMCRAAVPPAGRCSSPFRRLSVRCPPGRPGSHVTVRYACKRCRGNGTTSPGQLRRLLNGVKRAFIDWY